MGKTPPANAGDTASIPGPGKFHMPLGNNWASLPRACDPQQEKPRRGEACAPQLEDSPRPLAATRENSHEETKTQQSQ